MRRLFDPVAIADNDSEANDRTSASEHGGSAEDGAGVGCVVGLGKSADIGLKFLLHGRALDEAVQAG